MDTKTSERLNGPIRKMYQTQTNFRDVEKQVCLPMLTARTCSHLSASQLGKLEDRTQIAHCIRAHIDAWDDFNEEQRAELEGEDPRPQDNPEWIFNNVYLRSRKSPVTFASFAAQSANDEAFINFRLKVTSCLDDILAREAQADGAPLPLTRAHAAAVKISNTDKASTVVFIMFFDIVLNESHRSSNHNSSE